MPIEHLHGIDLNYESHGEGPAVVFLHGAGGNHISWWQQIPTFRERYRCITIDHRGFGASADPEREGAARFVDDLEALLDRQDSAFVADILELLLLCLHLGFQGRYAGSEGGELRNLMRSAKDKIMRIRGSAGPLSPRGLPSEGEVLAVRSDTVVRRLRLAIVGMVVGIVLMIGVLRLFSLSPRVEQVQELVDRVIP